MSKNTPKRRTGYALNTSSSKKVFDATPLRSEPPADTVRELGTIKAQLIGKYGSRGYGRILAAIREEAVTEEVAA